MQLTKQTDISLRVLMHLALEPEALGTIADIATRHNMSRNHLVKVVHRLVGLGYLKSARGRGGGVALARPASAINVGEVVRATETTLDVVDCDAYACPLARKCILKDALNEATDAFLSVLDGYTVSDLTRNRRQLLRLIGQGR